MTRYGRDRPGRGERWRRRASRGFPRGGWPGVVETVAGEIREVDAAHEGQLVVDDHELLVVAVQRPLVRVERAHDGAVLAERIAHAAHGAPRHRIQRQGRAAPEQHAHGHAAGGRPRAGRAGSPAARPAVSAKSGRHAPAGDVDVRASARDRLGHARERLLAVDEHLDRVARRWAARRRPPRPRRTPTARAPSRPCAGAGDGARSSPARSSPRRRSPHARPVRGSSRDHTGAAREPQSGGSQVILARVTACGARAGLHARDHARPACPPP